jgi:hypothetical protein
MRSFTTGDFRGEIRVLLRVLQCCTARFLKFCMRLRLRGFPKRISLVLAMVIDPGMFDKPVLLSTGLAAQENTTCNPNAHVTSYSIQPGSAYTPSWGGGFATDPSYTQTEAKLIAYGGLTTC